MHILRNCKQRQLDACRLRVNSAYKFSTSYCGAFTMRKMKAKLGRHKAEVDGENTMITFNKQ